MMSLLSRREKTCCCCANAKVTTVVVMAREAKIKDSGFIFDAVDFVMLRVIEATTCVTCF